MSNLKEHMIILNDWEEDFVDDLIQKYSDFAFPDLLKLAVTQLYYNGIPEGFQFDINLQALSKHRTYKHRFDLYEPYEEYLRYFLNIYDISLTNLCIFVLKVLEYTDIDERWYVFDKWREWITEGEFVKKYGQSP